MPLDWGQLLAGQLAFYWDVHLRPRLEGLNDEEYFWEPVEGCWSLRRGADGRWRLDGTWPEASSPPSPPPVTTIAWRLVHIGATCLANRASTFFGDGSVPEEADMFDPRHVPADLPGNAEDAVAFLERAHRHWHEGVAGLDEEGLRRPLGADPMAELVIHINREVMHHGAEIALLRDLYRATGATSRNSRLVPRP